MKKLALLLILIPSLSYGQGFFDSFKKKAAPEAYQHYKPEYIKLMVTKKEFVEWAKEEGIWGKGTTGEAPSSPDFEYDSYFKYMDYKRIGSEMFTSEYYFNFRSDTLISINVRPEDPKKFMEGVEKDYLFAEEKQINEMIKHRYYDRPGVRLIVQHETKKGEWEDSSMNKYFFIPAKN